jgi:hypothetical protein
VRANVKSPTTAGLIRKWRKPGDFSSIRIPPMPWMYHDPMEISVS